MGKSEELAAAYGELIGLPWNRTVSGAQRVLFIVYEKELERTLRARLGEFESATRRANHEWLLLDCRTWFSEWLARQEYREAYFENPDFLGMKLEGDFRHEAARRLTEALESADDNTVVALVGVASLYGFLRLSEVIRAAESHIRGRLVVFFPGTRDGSNYRLLDARDGWNYLANCVTLHGGGASL